MTKAGERLIKAALRARIAQLEAELEAADDVIAMLRNRLAEKCLRRPNQKSMSDMSPEDILAFADALDVELRGEEQNKSETRIPEQASEQHYYGRQPGGPTTVSHLKTKEE